MKNKVWTKIANNLKQNDYLDKKKGLFFSYKK